MTKEHFFKNLPVDIMTHLAALTPLISMATNGFANYHAKGLHYVNLLRDDHLTIKLYFFTEEMEPNSRGWVVWPHTHSYDFAHVTLVGKITNHLFEVGPAWHHGDNMYSFEYCSPLRGGDGLLCLDVAHLTESKVEVCEAGNGYFLNTNQVHTISVEPGTFNVGLLFQYTDTVEGPTSMFADERNPECNDGLYGVMTHDHVHRLMNRLGEDFNGTGF